MKFYCDYYDKLNNYIDIDEIVKNSKQIFGNNTDEYLLDIYINHNIFNLIGNGKYMKEYYQDKYKLFKRWFEEIIDNPSNFDIFKYMK